MEYNTTRGPLMLPEYGRNVQNMIHHAMDLRDRDERNRAAQAIIEVMGQLNPHLRDVDDFRHKLWTHLFVMSDFKLDVDSPYEIPKAEELAEKPGIMEYPSSTIRFGHYGKYTQKILENGHDMENMDERKYLTKSMANFMKYQFLAHNNAAVENSVIANQLKELAKGALEVENPEELVNTNVLLKQIGIAQAQNQRQNNSGKKKYGSNNQNNQSNAKRKFKKQ